MTSNDKRGITDLIKGLLVSLDMKPLHLANKTGIANETIYRCLSGVRRWNLNHLRKIAPVLGVKLEYFFHDAEIPVLTGEVRDGQGPPQSQLQNHTLAGRTYKIQEDTATLSTIYDLEVTDQSLVPTFPIGSHVIAQRETTDVINDGDFVVFWSEDGLTYVRQITLNSDHIVLHSLSPDTPDKIIPLKLLTCCDKIIEVKFR